MKKILYLLLIGCVALAAFWYVKSKDTGIYERNEEAEPAAYAMYPPIDTAYQLDGFSVTQVCVAEVNPSASPNPIRVYQSVNEQLIIDCDAQRDEDTKGDTRYYKIDKEGQLVDSLYVSYNGYWTVLVDGFLLSTKEEDAHFRTWPLNGDTTRQPVQVHNADFAMPAAELEAALQEAKENSQYYVVRTYVQEGTFSSACYYCIDDRWHVLWKRHREYQSETDAESAVRYEQELYRSGEPEPYLPADVTLEHVHPQEKIKYFHIIGGGAGGTAVVGWRGTGFFKTTIADSSFRFRMPHLVVEKERHDSYQTRVYQVLEPRSGVQHLNMHFYQSPLGFALYAPDGKHLYLIRRKT
ncbi:hypothetical protein [Sphingobacterium bambusae]|uniref:Uncharacterized protein n=1 Tax=Sphingobacterium bambusae TaxID=662858 RepID=A0ABW6BKK8_9SPHI|nr:hypothetical protein [Sphingobacterium bambusae]WPL50961.1 hypothetical protein SCB77_10925 [Sphingobacterium bambusae]